MPLHPVVEKFWARQQEAGLQSLSTLSVSEARQRFSSARGFLGEGPPVAKVEELDVAGPEGPVRCRLYLPKGDVVGLCTYFHGGGWVLGTLDDFDALVRALAQRSGCAVLSVDYRLAPEHRFPAALEDARAAILWAASEGAAEIGVDPSIVVAGDSAGGNLATVSALELGGDADIRLQVLFNPSVDVNFDTPSYRAFGSGYLLTSDDVLWFLNHYEPSGQWTTPRIAPIRSSDLGNAPAAWIGVAEYDLLRHEGEAYAELLRAAGRPSEFHRYDGVMHGFARLFNMVDVADKAVSDAAAAMRQALSR